jgi:hypothetical protein
MNTSSKGITNVEQCPPYMAYIASEDLNYDAAVKVFESYFTCAGMCV